METETFTVDKSIEIDLADLRPSNKQWPKCTASPFVIASRNIVEKPPGPWMDEGTLAHYVWRISNQPWLEGFAFPEISLTEEDITEEMKQCAKACNEYVSQFTPPEDTSDNCEEVVPKFYNPDQNCTIDRWVVVGDELHIFDLKYGKGKLVKAFENTQQLIYAESLIRDKFPSFEFKRIHIHILQFRIDHWDCWTCDIGEFKKQIKKIQEAYDQITIHRDKIKFYISEETCNHFCPIAFDCPARHVKMANKLPSFLRPNDSKKLNVFQEIPMEQLIWFHEKKKEISSWLTDLDKEFRRRVSIGKCREYRITPTFGHRAWVEGSEDKIRKSLVRKFGRAEVVEEKLLSPTKILAMCKKEKVSKKFQNLVETNIFQPPGKGKLVKNKTQTSEIEEAFDNYELPTTTTTTTKEN